MNRREFLMAGGAFAGATMTSGVRAATGGADKLAIFGGTPVMSLVEQEEAKHVFDWPIVNKAMREASDRVLATRQMSGKNIAKEFEAKFCAWQGSKYALCCLNGTTALNTAFYCVGVGPGDEVICPSITMWASCSGVVNLGGTVVFCDVKKDDFCIDPKSFEEHITPRTKAVVVVHYFAAPCDMDEIMRIAKKHGIKVIEDVSHAQGGFYKGRKLGTIGDIGAMSMMSGKSFAIGEAGMFCTDNEEYIYKARLWSSYARFDDVPKKMWARTLNVPFGGIKNRLNQCTCAVGIEQLKKYDRECAEIDKAMKYYHAGLESAGVKCIKMIYPKWENSTKAGWYSTRAVYVPEANKDVDVRVFAKALIEETGKGYSAGCNFPLHWSSLYDDEDIFGNGKPPCRAGMRAGAPSPKELWGKLPVSEITNSICLGIPWFRNFGGDGGTFESYKPIIDRYIEATRKVCAHAAELKDYSGKADWAYWDGGWQRDIS